MDGVNLIAKQESKKETFKFKLACQRTRSRLECVRALPHIILAFVRQGKTPQVTRDAS